MHSQERLSPQQACTRKALKVNEHEKQVFPVGKHPEKLLPVFIFTLQTNSGKAEFCFSNYLCVNEALFLKSGAAGGKKIKFHEMDKNTIRCVSGAAELVWFDSFSASHADVQEL